VYYDIHDINSIAGFRILML